MESPYFQKDSQGLFYSSTRFYKQFSIYAKEVIECDMIIDLIIKLSSRRKTEVRRRKTISISINRGFFFFQHFQGFHQFWQTSYKLHPTSKAGSSSKTLGVSECVVVLLPDTFGSTWKLLLCTLYIFFSYCWWILRVMD